MAITYNQALRKAVVCVGSNCVYCGKKAVHSDHIRSLFNNGKDDAKNMVAACKKM